MPSLLNILFSLLPGFSLAFFLIPLLIFLSKKFSLYDPLSERKIHKEKISRLGGFAIFLGFCFSLSLFYFQKKDFFPKNMYLILGGFLAFLTGFLDDIMHNIKARYKLFMHFLCGLMVVFSGHTITTLQITESQVMDLGFLSYPLTILWVAGFINAVNLLDGLDGLAGGILFIAFFFLSILGFLEQNSAVVVLALAGAASVLAFLFYNFPPAKIFMGDGGAYFLGYLYSITPLLGIKKSASLLVLLFPLSLFLIPVLDMIQVMHKRIKSKEHIFWADKKHIHHRLLHIGFSNRGILWLLYGYTVVLGFFSLMMVTLNPWQNWIIIALLFTITMLVFYTVSIAEEHALNKRATTQPVKTKKEGKIIALPKRSSKRNH